MVEMVILMILGVGWLVLGFIGDAERRQHPESGSPRLTPEVKVTASEAVVEEAKLRADVAPGAEPAAEPVAIRGLV